MLTFGFCASANCGARPMQTKSVFTDTRNRPRVGDSHPHFISAERCATAASRSRRSATRLFLRLPAPIRAHAPPQTTRAAPQRISHVILSYEMHNSL
eukprot:6191240-Pleurochrysis_carterae.AAC.5